ncbi:MAG: helix-turn-helix domain-containing protein [Methylosarcina sp.]|jgi:Fis family transcriptional regulator
MKVLEFNMETSNKSAVIINLERREMESAEPGGFELDYKNATSIPLSAYVRQAIELYFAQMKDSEAEGLHAMVISAVEKPLLEATLTYSGYNQTKAAKALGLSRSTLRKKLEQYGLS